MARRSVAVLSRAGRNSLPDPVVSELEAGCDVRYWRCDRAPDADEAAHLLAGVEVLAATNRCLPRLDGSLLDRLPRLRHVVLYATGTDHIDRSLLDQRGIALTSLPDYATHAVAEHGLALVLALATRLHLAHDRSRGVAPPEVSLRGVELAGRTVGIVGVGRIGTRLAELCSALGMRVVGCDVDPTAVARARRRGLTMASLPALLAAADVVSLCASHRFGGPPILAQAQLAALRPGTLVVNVARSALVDTAAIVHAIRAGRLRGYAVDDVVLDPEVDADLLAEGRVLQTGHSAWWRDEVLERGARLWGQAIVAVAMAPEPSAAMAVPAPAVAP